MTALQTMQELASRRWLSAETAALVGSGLRAVHDFHVLWQERYQQFRYQSTEKEHVTIHYEQTDAAK
jgi:hypothetical protein